ncbi:MAG: phosphoadenosine phosphosulfate reductase family protein, partial [Candidatus Dechloromonas phosphoritropha]
MSPGLLNITPELSASVAEKTLTAQTLLADIARDFAPATFASSLGAEDMVLTDLILKSQLPISIFSLDTGRLPAETHELMGAVEKRYGHKLTIFFPRADDVETYVRNQGINAFRDSVTLRKACCAIRKVEPL